MSPSDEDGSHEPDGTPRSYRDVDPKDLSFNESDDLTTLNF